MVIIVLKLILWVFLYVFFYGSLFIMLLISGIVALFKKWGGNK